MRIVLTAGQAGDAPLAHRLLEGQSAEAVIADTACDGDGLRGAIAANGAQAVVPSNPSRSRRLPLGKHLHEERRLVECGTGRLKQFRRVATRHEKTARNHLAVATVAAAVPWLR